jgi:hypothetical protein
MLSEKLVFMLKTVHSFTDHCQAIKKGEWKDVNFDSDCFECDDGREFGLDEATFTYSHSSEEFSINVPAIFLVFLPDDQKALYDEIKLVTNLCGGYQTQAAVASKYGSQRNKDQ